MAEETTGSVPEGLAADTPGDVDFTAVMSRAQQTLTHAIGIAAHQSADRRQMMRDFGVGTPGEEPTAEAEGD